MAKIEINDLNEEITISEEEIKHVNGGAGYLKIGDIDGESQLRGSTSWLEISGGTKITDTLSSPTWKI